MNEPPKASRPCAHADEMPRLQQRVTDTERALAELRENVARSHSTFLSVPIRLGAPSDQALESAAARSSLRRSHSHA